MNGSIFAIAVGGFLTLTKAISFTTINVQINQSMVEYSPPSMSGTFCQCLGFEKNGGSNGNLSVVCGSPLAAKTTMKMSTTTASSASRLLRSSSLVLSMERKAISKKKKKDNSDVTMSTTLSEEHKHDHRIGTFCLIYNL